MPSDLKLADNGLSAAIIEGMRGQWRNNPAMPFAQRVAFLNICDAALVALELCREAQSRDEVVELRAALRWALPLAVRALEDHRLNRLKLGHLDIGAGRGTDLGLWDEEVNSREAARAALSKSEQNA